MSSLRLPDVFTRQKRDVSPNEVMHPMIDLPTNGYENILAIIPTWKKKKI